MPDRPLGCPWANYPTHKRNRELQVDGFRPVVYGYCPQTEECGSCAGTTYKPNIVIQQGRSHGFVPCPYCRPADYRRRIERLSPQPG